MVKSDLPCRSLLISVYQDAFDVADRIVRKLKDEGVKPSLDATACREAFARDWFVARIAYLHVLARDIGDPELRKQFRSEIKASLTEVSKSVDDARECFAQYILLALNHLVGKRDSFGLLPGPGPFLSMRYDNHVRRLRMGQPSRMKDLQTTDEECMLISVLGDSDCWIFQGTLDEALSSTVQS